MGNTLTVIDSRNKARTMEYSKQGWMLKSTSVPGFRWRHGPCRRHTAALADAKCACKWAQYAGAGQQTLVPYLQILALFGHRGNIVQVCNAQKCIPRLRSDGNYLPQLDLDQCALYAVAAQSLGDNFAANF